MIVGECFDGWLSDSRALAVRPEHALEAIAQAGAKETREGAVGAGTGTTCFGYKAGVGTSSRRAGDRLLGCLVVSNYGARRDLHLLAGPVEEASEAPAGAARPGGLDHDRARHRCPLNERQLRRLGGRATFGLGRAGSFASNGSGEFCLAFSTAHRIAHREDTTELELRPCATTRPSCGSSSRPRVRSCTRRSSTRSARPTRWKAATATAWRAFPYELLERAPGVRRA